LERTLTLAWLALYFMFSPKGNGQHNKCCVDGSYKGKKEKENMQRLFKSPPWQLEFKWDYKHKKHIYLKQIMDPWGNMVPIAHKWNKIVEDM
jgi:hypothetical protein